MCRNHSWSSSDVQLYYLGLGAGADPMDPRELRYLIEDTPQVLPTFGNGAAGFHETEPPKVKLSGHRHRVEQGAPRQRGRDRAGAAPHRRLRALRHSVYRNLG
jgi:hypothetical protein